LWGGIAVILLPGNTFVVALLVVFRFGRGFNGCKPARFSSLGKTRGLSGVQAYFVRR
jgi:cytochrome b